MPPKRQGFFNSSETRVRSSHKQERQLGCQSCGLDKLCVSPRMEPTGDNLRGLMFIAEAQGENEDKQGKQLVGKAGQKLREALRYQGIDLDRDAVKLNALDCRPPGNRTPTDHEILCCKQRKFDAINKYKPRVIVLLGKPALDSVVGGRFKEKPGSISRWRGYAIPDRELNAWILPTFHPSYVMRNESSKNSDYVNPVIETVWNQDLSRINDLLDTPVPVYPDEESQVELLWDVREIVRRVEAIRRAGGWMAFDWEATGRKPYREGHYIYSCAITTERETIAFSAKDPRVLVALGRLLRDPNCYKIAHGMQFENMWAEVRVPTKVNGWGWCTMIAQHILDNREATKDLKFQAYVRYGLVNYNAHLEKYLKAEDDKDANAFNNIEQLDPKEVLTYNGVDSIITYRMALDQMEEMTPTQKDKAYYGLFHPGSSALGHIELNGAAIDTSYVNKLHDDLETRVKELKNQYFATDEVKVLRAKYGKEFNPNSPVQLQWYLFDHLKLTPLEKTDKDNPKVGKEALEKYGLNFLSIYSEMKNVKDKLLNTYCAALRREETNGFMHPFFKLHVATSYRSSSTNPNFQNFPVRDKAIMQMIRRGIIPRPGRQILEVDFGGLEVCISACVHKDPKMIEYIKDPSTDMHRDMAEEIWMVPRELINKDVRYSAKNGFVFPEFYGDYFKACGKNMWQMIDDLKLVVEDAPMREWLRGKGIRNLDDFTAHMREVEHRFWYERFSVYQAWKDETWARYCKDGYVDLITGFRCKEVMEKNQLLNRPIQGPAFHCLLWSLIQVIEQSWEEQWESLVIGQIHDSMVDDVAPNELDHVLRTTQKITCVDLPREWDWIIVPLTIEAEVTGIDRPWSEKKAIEIPV